MTNFSATYFNLMIEFETEEMILVSDGSGPLLGCWVSRAVIEKIEEKANGCIDLTIKGSGEILTFNRGE